MRIVIIAGFIIVVLLALATVAQAATTISGPTYLDPGATGTYAVSEAATIRWPKYLTGGSADCAYGPNTTTYRVFQCPAGGTFHVTASLTPGGFTISAGSYSGSTWTSVANLSVQVGPAPTPTPLPTPIPTPAPTPVPTVTITDLGGGTYQFSSANPIDVRFSRYASIVASDCPEKWFRHWTTRIRLGVSCAAGTSNVTLIFPTGTWTITANDGTYVSLTVVVP